MLTMTPEHDQRVNAILNELLNTPTADRERVLRRNCSGDRELESELRRLLSELETVLDASPVVAAAPSAMVERKDFAFQSGEILAGRFRIVRMLGRGGMGQVWEAFDEELREPVAIKTIRGKIASRPGGIDGFKREVLNARRVAHPNVCRVNDFFVHTSPDGVIPFLTMQLLRGETLGELLARKGKLPEPMASRILEDCAAGLKAAHAAGLVHGDFKPGNVMLVPNTRGDLTAVVTDFGLARYAGGESTQATITLPVAGTPGYMAPEQVEGRVLTSAADVYAYAVVACEVLTGQRPAQGGLDGLPPRWRAPIRKALDPDPASRGTYVPSIGTTRMRRRSWHAVFAMLVAVSIISWYLTRIRIEPVTIAVLPFTSESFQPEDLFFGEGLADEIISLLSRLPAVSVIALNSSAHFSDPNLDARDVAHRLRARYLVTGSLRPLGDRIQITAQLIDPVTNAILWLETYTRDRSQTVVIHAEIVRGLTSRLGMHVSLAQVGAFGSRTPRQDAVSLYERGRSLWSARGQQNLQDALQAFSQAISVDPNFALAHAARADTLSIMAEASYLPASEAFPRAKEAALQAIILDPQLPEAQAALGLVQSIGEWDLYNAEKSFQRALEIGPSYVYSHQWYANVLLKLGKCDQAIREAETAVRLDPLSSAALAGLGWTNFYSGRFGDALRVADLLSMRQPQFPYACLLRADSLIGEGAVADSFKALSSCSAEVQQTALYLRSLGVAQALSGDRSDAMVTLNQILSQRARQPVADSYLAAVYAALNLRNEAFYWLDQGITHRDPLTALVDVSPFFAHIRSDSRYPQVLARIGGPHKK